MLSKIELLKKAIGQKVIIYASSSYVTLSVNKPGTTDVLTAVGVDVYEVTTAKGFKNYYAIDYLGNINFY